MYETTLTKDGVLLENDRLRVDLNLSTLRGEIVFKSTDDRYSIDVGRTAGVLIGPPDPAAPTRLGPLGRLIKTDVTSQRVTLRFERDAVCFEAGFCLDPGQADLVCFIHPLSFGKDVVIKASFPGAIEPLQKSKVKFLIPIQQGVLMEEGAAAAFDCPGAPEVRGEALVTMMREGKMADFAGTPMVLQSNFWGVLGEHSSIMAILETPWDATLQLNGGRLSRPIWEPSLGHLRYERQCRYRFLPTGSYVDIANAYRAHLDRQGLCKTLKQKAEERPLLKKAFGAAYVVLGYLHDPEADYVGVLRKLKAHGINKALCSCAYTHFLGEGHSCMRVLPGTDLRSDAAEIRALGYLIGAFPNYGFMSPEYPTYDTRQMLKDFRQQMQIGFRLNDDMVFHERCREVMAYQNILHEDFWKDVDFLDFDQAIGWRHECYDPLHPHDHRHALDCVNRIFERALSQGLILMGEAHDDERLPLFDIMRTKSLAHVGRVPEWMGFPNKGWTIPLTELMFHDCFIYTWWEGDSYDNVHNHHCVGGNPEQQAVQDVLFGDPPSIFPAGRLFAPDPKPGRSYLFSQQWDNPLTQKSVDLAIKVCREIESVATDKMLSHRFLDEEGAVQETVFESGKRVVANVGKEAKEAEGDVFPPNAWRTY